MYAHSALLSYLNECVKKRLNMKQQNSELGSIHILCYAL